MSKNHPKPHTYLDFTGFQRTKTGWKGFYNGHWYGSNPDSKIQGDQIPMEVLYLNAEETLNLIKNNK